MSEKEQGNPSPQFDPEQAPLVGGIPVDFKATSLLEGRSSEVTGRDTGHKISIKATDYEIEIVDTVDSRYFFKVEFFPDVDPDDEEAIKNTIAFDMRTVWWDGDKRVRQPDFRVKELAEAAIQYFEEKYGELNGVSFQFEGKRYINGKGWQPPSDNYARYFEMKKKFLEENSARGMVMEEAERMAQEQAAFTTWSGENIAKPRGFTRVRDLEEYSNPQTEQEEVIGQFVRPLPKNE